LSARFAALVDHDPIPVTYLMMPQLKELGDKHASLSLGGQARPSIGPRRRRLPSAKALEEVTVAYRDLWG
jgi:hypothetical protein